MSETFIATPTFGGKACTPAYYAQVNTIVSSLRPTTCQRLIAEALNKAGLRTPRGLLFDRQRLANFLRTTTTVTTN